MKQSATQSAEPPLLCSSQEPGTDQAPLILHQGTPGCLAGESLSLLRPPVVAFFMICHPLRLGAPAGQEPSCTCLSVCPEWDIQMGSLIQFLLRGAGEHCG